MDRDQVIDLPGPQYDPEWNISRSNIKYWITAPADGLNNSTGLVVFLPGYGMPGDGVYPRKFRTFISDKYNCCVASVHVNKCFEFKNAQPAPDFYKNIKLHYGEHGVAISSSMNGYDLVVAIMRKINQRGINCLHPDCFFNVVNDEHNSFGLYPAIDALNVTNDAINRFGLNKGRVFSLGSSYGGYIAGLMLKIAPNTFRMLIDNSGFVNSDDDLNALYGINGLSVEGVKIAFHYSNRWSDNPKSINYYSDSCREVRDLLNINHVKQSETNLFGYHSKYDRLIGYSKKQKLIEVYANKVKYTQIIIDEKDLDGILYKSLDHGMNASLRRMFEVSYEEYSDRSIKINCVTDFDLHSKIELQCSDKVYGFFYNKNGMELVVM